MKWPRWLPRLLTEPVSHGSAAERNEPIPAPPGVERLGIRDVGRCEVCGRTMQARTRHEHFRGRVDCDCGFRNHVEFRDVRVAGTIRGKHITITSSRRFETTIQKPDLRLAWRYGICPSCAMGVRLLDSHIVAREDLTGTSESIAYYCTNCRLDDDARRGKVVGHDGAPVVDELRLSTP
jgi:hypothetical protein